MKIISKTILKDLCRLFLYFLTYTQKLSVHSLKAYSTDLRILFELEAKDLLLIKETFKIKIKDKIQLEDNIKFYINKSSVKHVKLSNSSRNRKIATTKSFIKYLAEQNYIKEDFRYLFKSPKVSHRVPSFLSIDEISIILDMFSKEVKTQDSKRDMVLFYLLYGAGLRISEACHVKNKDINLKNRVILIQGKGDKERLVSFPKSVSKYLKYLQSDQKFLFGQEALNQRKAYNIIKTIGEKAGLFKSLNPHALRHSFATHMLLKGINLRVLQELLGHKTLTATQKYTHLNVTQLFKTLEKYHPLHKKSLSVLNHYE